MSLYLKKQQLQQKKWQLLLQGKRTRSQKKRSEVDRAIDRFEAGVNAVGKFDLEAKRSEQVCEILAKGISISMLETVIERQGELDAEAEAEATKHREAETAAADTLHKQVIDGVETKAYRTPKHKRQTK